MKQKIVLKNICLLILVVCTLFLLLPPGFFILPTPSVCNLQTPKHETTQHHYQGLGVFFLNLDRSVARRQRLVPLLEALRFPFQRIVGVDSLQLGDAQLADFIDVKNFQTYYDRVPEKGEILCTHSHIQAWKAFEESNYAYALILEDDAAFEPHALRALLQELTEKKANAWDICNLDVRPRGEKRWHVKLTGLQTGGHVVAGYRLYGADAYLLNRKAVKALLVRKAPLRLEIEKYFTRGWEHGLRYTAVLPRPVVLSHQGSISRHLKKPHIHEDQVVPSWRRKITATCWRMKTGIAETLWALWTLVTVLFQKTV